MHDAAYSTRIRKPKRRAPTNSSSASRTRSRDLRDRAVTRCSSSSTPTEQRPSPDPPVAPKPHLWVAHDIIAMAKEVSNHGNIEFERFFGGSHPKLPLQLQRKTRGDVIGLMRRLANFNEVSPQLQINQCNHDHYLAVLASELSYVTEQKNRRDLAMASLKKARTERKRVDQIRAKLATESKAIAERLRIEKAKQLKIVEEKANSDKTIDAVKKRVDEQRNKYARLRETLDLAKFSELEARRRLDRIQLKISAMLGDMIIPTLDCLSDSKPHWLGRCGYDILPQFAQTPENEDSQKPFSKPPEHEELKRQKELGVNGLGYESILDESKEEQQLRLLKYRLRMCEMETVEWESTYVAEEERIRLISRSRVRLEEELQRQKQLNRELQHGKPPSGPSKAASKGGNNGAKNIAKIRATVRASLPTTTDLGTSKATVKKSRKGKAVRSLHRTSVKWS